MAKKQKKTMKDFDLNNDGKFDKEDKKIAASVLASDSKNVIVPKEKQYVANQDINLTYRKGSLVPESQIAKWKECGINYSVWFD